MRLIMGLCSDPGMRGACGATLPHPNQILAVNCKLVCVVIWCLKMYGDGGCCFALLDFEEDHSSAHQNLETGPVESTPCGG